MSGFLSRITEAPRAYDPARGAASAARVAATGGAGTGPFADLLTGAAGSSPYLNDLIEREAEWLAEAINGAPEDAFAALLAAPSVEATTAELSAALRVMKRRAALLIALADLGGVWSLEEITGALSDLADRAAALAFAHSFLAERSGPLAGMTPEQAGLIVLAMGKGGARELNYSSDIDLVLFYDDARHGEDAAMEAKPRWPKIAQRAVKLLSEVTSEGYVFRVDLRLRPNPSVTPICVSVEAAEHYYESVGRTWERAAFIKARPAAGDLIAGEALLKDLAPFIWRRHLDFAALEDINDIRAKIRDAKGLGGLRDLPGYDLKLGPGGIREIEFFVQTQQLALGGRDRSLRVRGTLPALAALTAAGRIGAETRDALTAHYRAHRRLEHRFQMIADAQTHAMPRTEAARDEVAALGGWPDRAAMEAETASRLGDVRTRVQAFFGIAEDTPAERGLDEVVASLPFARPEVMLDMAERWALGGVTATRDSRARRKFRALAPQILERLAAAAGDPDEAVLQFDRFLSGLPAGVQLFSLFEANPQLLDLLAEICAAAPRLAEYLGRNARVLDAVLDVGFFSPLPGRAALSEDLARALSGAVDFEKTLDGVRAWAKEQRFRVGVQVLGGLTAEDEAGRAFTDIADACLIALLPAVEAEFARRHGPPPGRGAVVVGMGKLGSREMTAASDLDLIVLYDAAGVEHSSGPKPLTTQTYFARLTKALVNALTTLTAEGALYEVDMRLRPSGGQGPVAVALQGFEQYQLNDAWTWEHMALTRARPVAGDAGLQADIAGIIRAVLTAPRDVARTRADVAEMHGRLLDAHKSARGELWALKHGDGGLMDIEFVAQNGALAASLPGPLSPRAALERLAEVGALMPEDAATLSESYRLQSVLQHVERVALTAPLRADTVGDGLKTVLARAGGVEDFEALEARLVDMRARAHAIVTRALGA